MAPDLQSPAADRPALQRPNATMRPHIIHTAPLATRKLVAVFPCC